MTPLFIGGLGTGELVVIALVLIIFFGGAKLPALMRGAGRGVREFKDAINEPADAPRREDAAKNEESIDDKSK